MKTAPTTSGFTRWFPKTVRGRVLGGLGGALLLAGAILGGSLWMEHRFPSDDTSRVLLPRTQHAVTKPIVDTIGRQVGRAIQRRGQAPKRQLTPADLAWFMDDRVDLASRRATAYELARDGSPAALAALLKVLPTAPTADKIFMVRLIARAGNPQAIAALLPLLHDAETPVVLATMRSLTELGGESSAARLGGILADNQRAEEIRTGAAVALGNIRTPVARAALLGAFADHPTPNVATQILNSLGRFEFSTVAATFREYLAAPESPARLRVVAAEALANSTSDAVPFLLTLAGTESDADVRAGAAWAISLHSSVTDLSPTLIGLAAQEPQADVRRRLYEALLPQTRIAGDQLLSSVLAEQDIAARVAGFNALGCATKQAPASGLALEFDRQIVPELVRIATAPNSLNIQLRAVFALRRAQTPAAQAALAEISQTAVAQIATAARNGLRATSS